MEYKYKNLDVLKRQTDYKNVFFFIITTDIK